MKDEQNKKRYYESNLKTLIENGVRYMEIPYVNHINYIIDMNLLMVIREFIASKSDIWYRNYFKNAYSIDINYKNGKCKKKYSNDGIKYYCKGEIFDKCILYPKSKNIKETFDNEIKISSLYTKSNGEYYTYEYINEIDHFFTHAINSFILMKKGNKSWTMFNGDEGMEEIKNQIEQEFLKD